MANFNRPFGSDKQAKTPPSAANSTAVAPSGTNKDLWEQAEHAWLNQSGGSGVSDPKARQEAIRVYYDQMIANDKQIKEWGGGSGILGDIGEK